VDQIRESLDRISELSEDELESLKDAALAEFETVASQDPTEDVVKTMTQLAEAAEAVVSEQERRAGAAAALSSAAAEAAARIKAATGGDDDDAEGEDPDAGDDNGSDDDDNAFAEQDPAVDATDAQDTTDAGETDAVDAPAAPAADDAAPAADPTDDTAAGPADATDPETAPDDEAAASATEPAPAADDDSTDDSAPADATADADAGEGSAPVATPEAAQPGDADTDQDGGATESADPDALTDGDKQQLDSLDTTSEAPTAAEAANDIIPEAELASESNLEAELASETHEISEETVTASAEGLEFQAPADRAPAVDRLSAPVTITAGADIPGITAGSELPNFRAVAQAIIDRRKGMGRTSGGDGEQHTVAVFTTSYPEERVLSATDIEGNREKLDAVVASEAIVAAGGISAPVEVRYELFGLGELDRPVKDSLAVFGADRGGVRYITPPVLTDLDGAVSLWTVDDDVAAASGSTPVKPALRVAAGAEVVVYVDAIPLILTFGNMGARAYPELVERHTQLGMISHARFAETRILTRLGTLSTTVTAASALGASRDVLAAIDLAAAAYRNRHRMQADAPLRVIFPEWFKAALRSDIIKQLPGDGADVTFALTDATINSWFADRNINITWTMDGEAGQIFGAQAAGNLNGFPSTVIYYLFAEGTFLFLDGGTLDLGLVRDSTLNATNDYKVFIETFEAVAKVGVEAIRVVQPLAIKGSSSATVTV
jgi:hypothetical protein